MIDQNFFAQINIVTQVTGKLFPIFPFFWQCAPLDAASINVHTNWLAPYSPQTDQMLASWPSEELLAVGVSMIQMLTV